MGRAEHRRRRDGDSGPGVVLAQHLTQPLQVPGPVPDQALMRARDQLQALDLARATGDRAVMGAIDTHDLGSTWASPGSDLAPDVVCRSR